MGNEAIIKAKEALSTSAERIAERQYGKTNNAKLLTRVPGRRAYVYADASNRRADRLFIRSEIPVKFDGDYEKDDQEYVIVFCHFKKKHEAAFLECMADLERALVMDGHGDYPSFCEEVVVPLMGEGAGMTGGCEERDIGGREPSPFHHGLRVG